MIVDLFPERLLLDIPAIERRTRTRTSAWTFGVVVDESGRRITPCVVSSLSTVE